MRLTFLKSKIHRARVTDANLEYQGSVSIDRNLCELGHLHEYEKVEIYNCNNGERFSTYVIYGNNGEVCLNGAAARLAHKGDLVIICSYAELDQSEVKNYKPTVVFVDHDNVPVRTSDGITKYG